MKKIEPRSAFSPGVQLWMLAGREHSGWARRLDWYLNFQLARAELPRTRSTSDGLKQLTELAELDFPEIAVSPNAALMIASSSLVPNHQTIVVGFTNLPEWCRALHVAWTKLNAPTVRVLLPRDLRANEFAKHWPNTKSLDDLEVVEEEEGSAWS